MLQTLSVFAGIASIVWFIYAGLRLSQTSLAILIEKKKATEALIYSWNLTRKGKLWYIVGWIIALGFVGFVLAIPSDILDSFIEIALPALTGANFLTTALEMFFLLPLSIFASLTIYDRLKDRSL